MPRLAPSTFKKIIGVAKLIFFVAAVFWTVIALIGVGLAGGGTLWGIFTSFGTLIDPILGSLCVCVGGFCLGAVSVGAYEVFRVIESNVSNPESISTPSAIISLNDTPQPRLNNDSDIQNIQSLTTPETKSNLEKLNNNARYENILIKLENLLEQTNSKMLTKVSQLKKEIQEQARDYLCPVYQTIMDKPVRCLTQVEQTVPFILSNKAYEQEALETAYEKGGKEPCTQRLIKQIVNDDRLRNDINDWLTKGEEQLKTLEETAKNLVEKNNIILFGDSSKKSHPLKKENESTPLLKRTNSF